MRRHYPLSDYVRIAAIELPAMALDASQALSRAEAGQIRSSLCLMAVAIYTAEPYIVGHAWRRDDIDIRERCEGSRSIGIGSYGCRFQPVLGSVGWNADGGTGGARKVRHAGRGHGKSGGFRTIHYYGGDDIPIFLLAIFGKGEKDNLTKAERNELAKILPQIAANYRKAAKP